VLLIGLALIVALPVGADEKALLAQLRANLVEKPSAVRESLLPGLYGVYFNVNEPRTYVDGNFVSSGCKLIQASD